MMSPTFGRPQHEPPHRQGHRRQASPRRHPNRAARAGRRVRVGRRLSEAAVSWSAGSTAFAIVRENYVAARRTGSSRVRGDSATDTLATDHGAPCGLGWRDATGRVAQPPLVASPAGRGHLRGLVEGPLLDTLSAKSSHEHSSGSFRLGRSTALSRTFGWAIGASIAWPPRCQLDPGPVLDDSRHISPGRTTPETADVPSDVGFRPTASHGIAPH
jgi:hypothetical protein